MERGWALLYSFQLQLMWSEADDCGPVANNLVPVAVIVVPLDVLVAISSGQSIGLWSHVVSIAGRYK
jgi:hypothetical protein